MDSKIIQRMYPKVELYIRIYANWFPIILTAYML